MPNVRTKEWIAIRTSTAAVSAPSDAAPQIKRRSDATLAIFLTPSFSWNRRMFAPLVIASDATRRQPRARNRRMTFQAVMGVERLSARELIFRDGFARYDADPAAVCRQMSQRVIDRFRIFSQRGRDHVRCLPIRRKRLFHPGNCFQHIRSRFLARFHTRLMIRVDIPTSYNPRPI